MSKNAMRSGCRPKPRDRDFPDAYEYSRPIRKTEPNQCKPPVDTADAKGSNIGVVTPPQVKPPADHPSLDAAPPSRPAPDISLVEIATFPPLASDIVRGAN